MKKLIIAALLVSSTAMADAPRLEKALYTRVRSCVEIAKLEDNPLLAAIFKSKADDYYHNFAGDKAALNWAVVSNKFGFRKKPEEMSREQRKDAIKTCNDIIW
ncbi:hypothetical protein ACTL6P_20270 [Endozoicomonas acroporae]|uniref:hypothetical protein n=1 Tax=Endozoicomonas acroporae TaxID=1701104 RepID=UPI000C75E70C|nr:hypothetical protein [Endozoicomonas acroporae]